MTEKERYEKIMIENEKGEEEYNKYLKEEWHCPDYKALPAVHKMLEEAKIPHTFKPFINGYQIVIWSKDEEQRLCDAVQTFGSYGMENDKIEIMGALTQKEREIDSVLGYLTAEEVFKRFKWCWEHQSETYGG